MKNLSSGNFSDVRWLCGRVHGCPLITQINADYAWPVVSSRGQFPQVRAHCKVRASIICVISGISGPFCIARRLRYFVAFLKKTLFFTFFYDFLPPE
jgi:hypothetical protein